MVYLDYFVKQQGGSFTIGGGPSTALIKEISLNGYYVEILLILLIILKIKVS